MKKQELIHLHGLLAEVSNYCVEEGHTLPLDEYEAQGVRPTSIHKSKTDHKEAVFDLVHGITGGFESTEQKEPVSAAAD